MPTLTDTNKLKLLNKAIRIHCLSCSGDSTQEVDACTIKTCALYPYRLGKLNNIVLVNVQRRGVQSGTRKK